MNLLFGSASVSGSAAFSVTLRSGVSGTFPGDVRLVTNGNTAVGSLSDGGAIVGYAENTNATLIYVGALIHPLPDWSEPGRAIDDPDRTARYLLARFDAVGPEFLLGVGGQFAVAISDKVNGRVLLGTDPAGGRQLFVYEADGELAFSSNLASLVRGLGARAQVDRSYEDFFLLYGFYPFGRTPYANVRALPPGTLLEWRNGQVRSSVIPDIDPWKGAIDHRVDSANVVDRLFDAMLRAMSEQLPTERQRVAVLLGGFDSALVAALIVRLGYPVETYSFRFADESYNQPHVDMLSAYLGIRHHWVDVDRQIVESGLKSFADTFNQPTNWPNYVIQTAYVCEQIRADGIKHCYSGDGCDAVFLGYPGTYLRARVVEALPGLPGWLARALVFVAARPSLERIVGHPYRVFLSVLRGLGRSKAARGYLTFRIMDEVTIRQLRKDVAPPQSQTVDAIVEKLAEPYAALPSLRIAYQGKAAVSPNRNKLIGSSDKSGITIMAPYLHPGLKRFALALPEELLRPKHRTESRVTGKHVLMRMAAEKELLPPSIIFQKKVAAVDAPIDDWYDGLMREPLLSMLNGLPFSYDAGYVNRLLDKKATESLFKRYVLTDKVISHAASLLATYAAFTGLVPKQKTQT